MSLSLADSSYIGAISQWITNHQWVGSGQQQSILVVQADDSAQQYHLQSGYSYFEISASYTPGVDQLDNLTVSLDIPSFGLVLLAEESTYPLSADPGQNLIVSVADITGNVSFKYVGDGDDTEVFSDYILDVPFSSTLEDSISIFPVDFQRVMTIESSQSSNLKRSEGKVRARLETSDSYQQQLLLTFLQDFTVDTNRIVIQAWDTSDTAASQETQECTVDLSFLEVLNLVASVDPGLSISASLYVKIPFVGRVRIANLIGDLGSGITTNIDTVVTSGTATLTAEQNSSGKHSLYITVDLNVKSVGRITASNFLLLDMPF